MAAEDHAEIARPHLFPGSPGQPVGMSEPDDLAAGDLGPVLEAEGDQIGLSLGQRQLRQPLLLRPPGPQQRVVLISGAGITVDLLHCALGLARLVARPVGHHRPIADGLLAALAGQEPGKTCPGLHGLPMGLQLGQERLPDRRLGLASCLPTGGLGLDRAGALALRGGPGARDDRPHRARHVVQLHGLVRLRLPAGDRLGHQVSRQRRLDIHRRREVLHRPFAEWQSPAHVDLH